MGFVNIHNSILFMSTLDIQHTWKMSCNFMDREFSVAIAHFTRVHLCVNKMKRRIRLLCGDFWFKIAIVMCEWHTRFVYICILAKWNCNKTSVLWRFDTSHSNSNISLLCCVNRIKINIINIDSFWLIRLLCGSSETINQK